MIELLFLKIHHLASQTPFTLGLIIVQVINAMIVFATFEYHWLKTHDDDFYVTNKILIRSLDKTTYEFFRYLFIVLPLTSVYMLIRMKLQKFDSVFFLRDYGVHRKL